MVRIFLPLAALSTMALLAAMGLGLEIDDPRVANAAVQSGVQWHFLVALAALCLATLVHAIVLTYFMGTGRWIEETSNAYKLPATFFQQNQSIKYRTIPPMVGAFLLLLCTGALGAAADPASPLQSKGWLGLSPATIHLIAALASIFLNLAVNYLQFLSLERNGEIVDQVLAEVKRIRLEKGLAVE